MKPKPGDTVRFLNEKGGGIVTAVVNSTMVRVTISDGLDIPMLISELVVVSEEKEKDIKEQKKLPPMSKEQLSKLYDNDFAQRKPSGINKHKSERLVRSETWEVDLHIEELTDNYSRMSNAEIVIMQVSHFQKVMDKALKENIRKVIVIHGVGTGVLKNEIRRVLRLYSGIKFYDANDREYGQGATEVVIQ